MLRQRLHLLSWDLNGNCEKDAVCCTNEQYKSFLEPGINVMYSKKERDKETERQRQRQRDKIGKNGVLWIVDKERQTDRERQSDRERVGGDRP